MGCQTAPVPCVEYFSFAQRHFFCAALCFPLPASIYLSDAARRGDAACRGWSLLASVSNIVEERSISPLEPTSTSSACKACGCAFGLKSGLQVLVRSRTH